MVVMSRLLRKANRRQWLDFLGHQMDKVSATSETTTAPLLYGMTAAARFLGVSRATLWRILQSGRLKKLEIMPGSFRVRRADLEAFAGGRVGTLPFGVEGRPVGRSLLFARR